MIATNYSNYPAEEDDDTQRIHSSSSILLEVKPS